MERHILISAVESILFAADRPVSLERLKTVFEDSCGDAELGEVIQTLRDRYTDSAYGFEIREAQGGFHFVSKVGNAEWVRKFLAMRPFRLGRSTLETMAIIAYRQPITRAQIDAVRGIDSSHLLRTLIERGLVKMAGKAEVPGRPVQYATTPKFLETVGLNALSELPPLTELDELQGDTVDPIKALEEGLDRFIEDTPASQTDESEASLDEGLQAIETMIHSAEGGTREIMESPLHADVRNENIAAQEGAQTFLRPIRRMRQPKPIEVVVENIPTETETQPTTEDSPIPLNDTQDLPN